MADVAAQRTAIQSRLQTAIASGVRWYDVWPNKVNLPAGAVERAEGPDRQAFGGFYRTLYHVVFLAAPLQGIKRAQEKLDPYLATSGASSVKAALEADRTLGGVVQYLLVGAPLDDEPIEANGVDYLGARVPVEVFST